ncbi:hypothetical protein CEP51_004000 [Fusarium floridanum]|nr:hypothetical protein CEP51_004000 [Fusarium floridanum]
MEALAILGAQAAVLQNATALIEALGAIVEKAREAKNFRRQCLELSNMCISLSMAFLNHEADLKDTQARNEFQSCLRDVHLAVAECRGWSALHVGWEVFVQHKFKSLKSRLESVQQAFGTELLIKVKSSSTQVTRQLTTMQSQLVQLELVANDHDAERSQFLDRIRGLEADLTKSQQLMRSLVPLPPIGLDIVTLPDPRVAILSTEAVDGATVPITGEYQGLRVTFEKIAHTHFEKLPHVVQIYQQMGNVALVQQFYAIVELDGSKYAVMEDMASHQSIQEAATTGRLATISELQGLRFIHELATTVSTLHRVGILIKSLSHLSVCIVETADGNIRPRLTGLSQARAIWEVSNKAEQDVRFEAPETEKIGSRSKMSDVWSLITVILCFLTRSAPFGVVRSRIDSSQATSIREKLRSGDLPFQPQDVQGHNLAPQVRSWLQPDPFNRPPASSVAQSLFEALIRRATEANPPTPPISDPDIIGPAELLRFASDILSKAKVKSSKSKDGKRNQPQTGEDFLDQTRFNALKAAGGDSDASLSFAAGVAYMAGLVNLPSETLDTFGDAPREVIYAKLAIPYLDVSNSLGHSGAVKELLRAHKTLAKYYHGLLAADDEG